MKVEINGDIEIIRRLGATAEVKKALRRAIFKELNRIRGEMVNGLKKGAPGGKKLKPNAPSTIAQKGSSKPLIDSGGLLGSIGVQVVGFGGFVGVRRRYGNVNLASLHERGAVIRQSVTPQQRKFFMAMSIKAGVWRVPKVGKVITIRIPARPFISPVLAKESKEKIIQNIEASMANDLRGTLA